MPKSCQPRRTPGHNAKAQKLANDKRGWWSVEHDVPDQSSWRSVGAQRGWQSQPQTPYRFQPDADFAVYAVS